MDVGFGENRGIVRFLDRGLDRRGARSVTRDQVKAAADALARLEALEAALKSAQEAPHDALPISFFEMGNEDPESYSRSDDHGIKAFYPRSSYIKNVAFLIADERAFLEERGVKL